MKKRRYIAAAISMAFLTLASMEISGNVDLLLTGGRCTANPISVTAHLLREPRALKLFLILVIASALLIFWAMYGKSYLNYRSDMYEVVPGFSIPRPEGQGQHGTAWFLPKNEFDHVFASAPTSGVPDLSESLRERYNEEGRRIKDESR